MSPETVSLRFDTCVPTVGTLTPPPWTNPMIGSAGKLRTLERANERMNGGESIGPTLKVGGSKELIVMHGPKVTRVITPARSNFS